MVLDAVQGSFHHQSRRDDKPWKKRYAHDRVHGNANNEHYVFVHSEHTWLPQASTFHQIMDGHYNTDGASESWINEMVLITMAHGIKILENSLCAFVAERHNNDANQLTNIKYVRVWAGANEGGYWQPTGR